MPKFALMQLNGRQLRCIFVRSVWENFVDRNVRRHQKASSRQTQTV